MKYGEAIFKKKECVGGVGYEYFLRHSKTHSINDPFLCIYEITKMMGIQDQDNEQHDRAPEMVKITAYSEPKEFRVKLIKVDKAWYELVVTGNKFHDTRQLPTRMIRRIGVDPRTVSVFYITVEEYHDK